VTAAGHATIATGTFPSRHGIVGNEFWDRLAGEIVEAVRDSDSRIVGGEGRYGWSPARLERPAVGDWLRAQSPDSKVYGVSLKERSAIFLSGLGPDGAYWYDERSGRFVTSSYYRDALPAWIEDFNAAAPVDQFFGSTWTTLLPDDRYGRAEAGASDASDAGERRRYSEFPHRLGDPEQRPDRRYYNLFRRTPFADQVTLEFTRALIDNEDLGADATPDLLLLGLAAADYIGHRYGPWSDEVHDHFVRLDRYLGELFAELDDRLGRDNYLVVLSSDHGVMPVPEHLAEIGVDAARIHPSQLLEYVEPIVNRALERGLISTPPTLRYEYGVVFDFGDAEVTDDQRARLARLVADELERHPSVEDTFTYSELLRDDPGNSPQLGGFQRSFHPDRSPDVVLLLRENHLVTDERTGTSHGSPRDYDSLVPLIFWGTGIRAARHSEAVRTVDVAPTLASLLGLTMPDDLDGTNLAGDIGASE
jgi:predicted AlkP superfamily pyrophosphatase or phosphodiesterase